jgi:hypothetical protein
VLLFMPALREHALTDYADVPLACFFVAAALLLGLWLAGGTPGALPLAALFAAAALATKRDAIALCSVLAAVALAAALVRRASLGQLALALAFAAASTIPWRVFVAVHHLHDRDVGLSPGRVGDHAGQLGWILGTLGGFLLRSEYLWVVPLAGAAALVVLLRGPERELAAGALVLVGGLLLALVFVYLNGAAGVRYLVRTSGQRTLLPAVLLAAALLPLLLSRALRVAPEER